MHLSPPLLLFYPKDPIAQIAKGFYAKEDMEQTQALTTFYFSPRQREIILLLALGAIVGGLVPLLSSALGNGFIAPVFCRSAPTGLCSQIPVLSYNIVLCLLSLIALAICVREQIFRPALVVLPHVIVLWSLPQVLFFLAPNLLGFSLLHAIGSAILLVAFYWLVRLRAFWLVILFWVSLVVLARSVLVA